MKPAETGSASMPGGPAQSGSSDVSRHEPGRKKLWWRWGKRVLTVAFLVAVGALLATQAKSMDWAQVAQALRAYPVSTLLAAAALAVVSHLLFSSFDLLGRIYTKHGLSRLRVMTVAAVCYAFTLNLGALVGGVGFRYRLYSRLGLENGVITRVYALSVVSNWLGYLLLLGGLFVLRQVPLPSGWKTGAGWLQLVGAGLIAIVVVYLLACGLARRRSWTLRGHEVTLPSLAMALVQLAVSVSNWLLMGAIIYLLMQQKIEFATALSVLMLSAVAGVVTHVPAGLGVLEAVFITTLGHRMPVHDLLAGLLAYRAVYYLAPLAVAVVLYGTMEARAAREA